MCVENVGREGVRPRLDELYATIATRFVRAEPRQRALSYVHGLLGLDVPGGDERPHRPLGARDDGAQRLLTTACWDEELVRDDVRAFVLSHLGRERSVLCVAETGFVKRGACSAGVQRQFCQETRKVENCQLGLFLLHSAGLGKVAAIDRELYMPRQWGQPVSAARRRTAGNDVPPYRSKIQLAAQMVGRALEGGAVPQWVVLAHLGADTLELSAELRTTLERARIQYLVRLGHEAAVATAPEVLDMRRPNLDPQSSMRLRAGRSVRAAAPRAMGPYRMPVMPGAATDPAFERSVLVRPVGRGGATEYYLCHARRDAGTSRSTNGLGGMPIGPIAAFEEAGAAVRSWYAVKAQIGLGRYEVRSRRGWYRHVTLAMAAHIALGLSDPSL